MKYKLFLTNIVLISSIILSPFVYAKDISDSSPLSVNQEISENSENSCMVTVSQGSSFIVSIPKNVSLNGSKGQNNLGTYTISVKGNIDATEVINVVPDSTFKLKDNSGRKKDIDAVITQNVKTFQIGDVSSNDKVTVTEENILTGVSTEGKIETKELTAGSWTGFFNIKISLT